MSTFERMLKVLNAQRGDVAGGLTATRRLIETQRQRTARGKSRASKQAAAGVQAERLEQRLAMAIDIFPLQDDLASSWRVIVSDDADDVFIQQVATARQNLLVADNASFNNSQEVIGIDSVTSLYVTNGIAVSVADVLPAEVGGGTETSHVLSNTVVVVKNDTPSNVVSGRVSYAGNQWTFTNGGLGNSLTFTLVNTGTLSDPSIIRPASGFVSDGGSTANPDRIRIDWSAAPVAAPAEGIDSPVIDSISYTTGGTAAGVTDFNVRAAAGVKPLFVLPATATRPGGIVPGTLNGALQFGATSVKFCTDNLFTPILGNATDNHLFFENGSRTGSVTIRYDNSTLPTSRTVTFTGYVDYQTGQIFLEFSADPGNVSLNSHYAVCSQDGRPSQFTVSPGQTLSRDLYVQLLTPGSAININSPVIQAAGLGGVPGGVPGLTLNATNINLNAEVQSANRFDVGFNTGVIVTANEVPEVLTAVARPVIGPRGVITAIGIPSGMGGQGYSASMPPRVTIVGSGSGAAAEAVVMNGVVTAINMLTTGSGYDDETTITLDSPDFTIVEAARNEQLNFNAAVSASSYSLSIGDDPNVPATPRGRMFVSSSGSLTGLGGAAANSLFVMAETSDLVVEGQIIASSQSYLMQSPNTAQGLSPFTFSTVSPLTGVNVGLIQGTSVAITLGNDLDTPEQSSVAANTVNLQTKVESLRVTAATRAGDPLSGPFPYDLTISEQDAISIDAVAASSRAISLFAVGSLAFNSALATAGDLSIRSSGDFSVTAPLSTSRGQIAVSANSLAVTNSIRVLAPWVDDSRDDITLTANAGDLNLTGAISGVNNIRLVQRNKAGTIGKIGGSTRLVASGANVESEGSVSIRTDVVSLTGRAGGDFSIDELNDISIPSLRTPGIVTLRAAGTDPGAENPFTPNTIALQATLYDVTSLDVSAPRGSVAITTDTSKTLTLGKAAAIASGTATSMQAAGGVSIRSLAGPVIVADAPVAGGSAITARFAFEDNLSGAYNHGTPGFFASTLTGGRSPLLSEEGFALVVGDRVLLTGQANQNENGVYFVKVSGSLGRNWVLTRAADADTSGELVPGAYVRVLEGSHAEAIYTVGYASTTGDSPLAVSTVPNRAGAESVRVATTTTLAGSYDSAAATISGPGDLPLIDGVFLSVGDRVLVRMGTIDSPPAGTSSTPLPVSAANGVYEVVDVGGVGGTWLLARATNIDTGSAIETGYVLTTEGSFRAAVTGQAFAVAYESLGIDPLYVTQLMPGQLVTNIGTEDFNDLTTFVVSSAAGSNDAAGSLGKMISLRQSLDTSSSSLNPSPKVDFAFSSTLPGGNGGPAGVIRLTQELPAISKAFAINGASRVRLPGETGPAVAGITVDGSRITTTRTGQPAAGAAEVNGIEFVSGSQSAVGTAGGSVANLTIGGFANGSAVKINEVRGILVNKVVLGRSETGDRLINKFGVRAAGPGAEGTVSGSTIVGSTEAGIRTDSDATGLAIVGTTVGALNQGNKDGIQLDGGTSSVGLGATVDTKSFIQTFSGQKVFSLPLAISPRNLHIGQSVSGPGIPAGTTIAAINGSMVTISKAMTVTARTKGIRFASPARNTVQYNLTGMVLSGGNNVVASTDIGKNAYDGIRATGGIQTIGIAKKLNNVSNGIYGNGRSGVVIEGAPQIVVQGNYFGVKGKNQLANIVVNGVAQPAPRTRTRLDANGNYHAFWR
jgi:hypothetical protein